MKNRDRQRVNNECRDAVRRGVIETPEPRQRNRQWRPATTAQVNRASGKRRKFGTRLNIGVEPLDSGDADLQSMIDRAVEEFHIYTE